VKEIETTLSSFDHSNNIHSIEIDLLLSRIRFLYDDVKLLSQIDTTSPEPVPENTQTFPVPEIDDPITPAPITTQPTPSPTPTPPITPPPLEDPEPEQEPDIPEVDEPVIEPESPATTFVSQPASEPEDSPVTKNPNGNFLTGIKMQAVDDIMVAIGLNDRFLFTRELFNNNTELFTKTIDDLNHKDNWDEAKGYLEERFDWDSEDPTLVLFLSFVKRKYI